MLATSQIMNITEIPVERIPPFYKDEARTLSLNEISRCVDLLTQLDGEDWDQATDCTEWNVKDMAAHLAGSCAGYASWGEFFRQYVSNPYMQKGEDQIHGINRRQVAERKTKSPEEIIVELREKGPKAVNTRYKIPDFIRAIRMPLPPLGVVPVAYLLDTIYVRDEWMHRADICRATAKPMFLTKEHDGRIVDLVMADILENVKDQLNNTIHLHLTGDLERLYRFGDTSIADTIIMIDLLEFHRLASSRITAVEAMRKSQLSGDVSLGEWFLKHCEVGF